MILKLNFLKILFFVISVALCSCSPEDGADGMDGQDAVEDGVTFLVLSGAITNEEAEAKINERVGVNTQFVSIQNTTNLTSVTLSGISEAIDVVIKNNSALTSVRFPELENVTDFFSVDSNAALIAVETPALISVNRVVFSENKSLETINFPLSRAIEIIEIRDNPIVTGITFPTLEAVGELAISRNNSLVSFTMPQLARLGNLDQTGSGEDALAKGLLSITANDNLERYDFSSLTIFNGDLTLHRNPKLKAVFFDVQLAAESLVGQISILGNTAITTLNFTNLTSATSLFISDNEGLQTVNFPLLETIESQDDFSAIDTILRITDNPSLRTVNFEALRMLVAGIGINRNALLSELDLSSLVSFNFLFSITRNNFSSEAIDGFLAHLVAITPQISDINIEFFEQEEPSSQGLEDAQRLRNNGNFVRINKYNKTTGNTI